MTFSSQKGYPLTEKGFYQPTREFTALCPLDDIAYAIPL